MATNLAMDDRLIEHARKIGKHKTKKDAVTAALQEYIRSRKRILSLFGSIESSIISVPFRSPSMKFGRSDPFSFSAILLRFIVHFWTALLRIEYFLAKTAFVASANGSRIRLLSGGKQRANRRG